MKQFRATQTTTQYGAMHLHMRFMGKLIFMKGNHGSRDYVQKMIDDMRKKGAVILMGNGGWMRIDIIRSQEYLKLGDVEIDVTEASTEAIEESLYNFFAEKYIAANFTVLEVK